MIKLIKEIIDVVVAYFKWRRIKDPIHTGDLYNSTADRVAETKKYREYDYSDYNNNANVFNVRRN